MPASPETLHFSPQQVAESVAHQAGLSALQSMQEGPPRWVYTAGAPEPTEVIRVITPADAVGLPERIAVTRSLHEAGAPLQEFIGGPQHVGSYVATRAKYISRPLPDTSDGHHKLGEATALLHNAGYSVAESTLRIPGFDPLSKAREIFTVLSDLHSSEKTIRIGEIIFPMSLLPDIKKGLEVATQTEHELADRVAALGRLTIAHGDIYPANARLDNGSARLIDLDNLTTGPPEWDLVRAVYQWSNRFKRPPEHTKAFLDSYQGKIAREIDAPSLEWAGQIAEVRFSTSLLTRVVRAIKTAGTAQPWCVIESINRLSTLGDPDAPWYTLAAAREQNDPFAAPKPVEVINAPKVL